jgi:hypothetical protein
MDVDLGLAGRALESTLIEYTAILGFAGGSSLTLESPFTMTLPAGEMCLDPARYLEEDEDFDRVRRLVGVLVAAATYDKSGDLEVRFADSAAVIRSGPHSEYEAWNFAGTDGSRVVCRPSGGVTTWSPCADAATKAPR